MHTHSQPHLPDEIVEKIILDFEFNLQSRNWEIKAFNAAAKELVPLTRVCRQWHAIAESRLYHTIVLDVAEGFGGGVGLARARKLLMALQKNAGRSGYVRQLILRCSLLDNRNRGHTLWNLLSRGIYREWQHAHRTTPSLVACFAGIVDRCYNLQHFVTDNGSAFPAILMQRNLEARLDRVKTFIVPTFTKDIEKDHADKHVNPLRMLYMVELWPEIQEVQVKSFSVRSTFGPWKEPPIITPYQKMVRSDEYCLEARFFREFRIIWKKNVVDFGGTIYGDEQTTDELIKCLRIWSPHLSALRLHAIDVDYSYNKRVTWPKLTKVISELPNLRNLCISSNIFPPAAFTNPVLSNLQHLQYNIVHKDDIMAFKRMYAAGVLPSLRGLYILTVGHWGLYPISQDRDRLSTSRNTVAHGEVIIEHIEAWYGHIHFVPGEPVKATTNASAEEQDSNSNDSR